MEKGSAEQKSIKFQDQATITITVVGRLSEARKLILATGAVVLLDRYQRKGKSIVMFSAGPPLQVFNATKELLLRMTELVEVNGEQKNKLLKLSPEITQRIACYEVDNGFASLMRQIESVCEKREEQKGELMNFKEIVVRVTTKEAAKVAVDAGSNLVLLNCQKPDDECCNFVYYLFVNKKFNKDNKDKMREFSKTVHLKRLTDREKQNLLGKGTCAKVHCYEVDQVIEERLEPDTFKQYVRENTLHRCAPGIPVAPV